MSRINIFNLYWKCKTEVGTFLHCLWECTLVTSFWVRVVEILSNWAGLVMPSNSQAVCCYLSAPLTHSPPHSITPCHPFTCKLSNLKSSCHFRHCKDFATHLHSFTTSTTDAWSSSIKPFRSEVSFSRSHPNMELNSSSPPLVSIGSRGSLLHIGSTYCKSSGQFPCWFTSCPDLGRKCISISSVHNKCNPAPNSLILFCSSY